MASTVDETGASTAGTEGTGTAQGSTASAGESSAGTDVEGGEPLGKRLPVIFIAVGLVTTVVVLSVVAFVIVSGSEDEITQPTRTTAVPKLERAPSTISKDFLVCTVNGEGPSLKKLAAPRTLCNIIFFDSVKKEVRKEVTATFNDNSYAFLNWIRTQQGGEYGFSYSVETDFLRTKIDRGELANETMDLHTLGFRHTAVMNIQRQNATKEVFKVALHALMTAFRVVSKLESKQAIYSVLGAAIKDASTLRDLLSEMKDVDFQPSMFISITHISHEDRARQDCRILPPSWLSVPNGLVSYGHSLTSSCQLLKEVAKANVNITLAVSFTLSGHMYKPRGNDPDDYNLFKPCEDFTGNYYVTPYEFCKPNIFGNIETSEHYIFTFNTSAQRTLTFEGQASIQNKVCEAKSTCKGVTFGVAAYDIEYDIQRSSLQCSEFGLLGRFGRLALLREMNRHLTSLTSAAAFDKEECLRVDVQ